MNKAGGTDDPAAQKACFLEALALTSNVAASARIARVSTSWVYRCKQDDLEFCKAWRAALAQGYELLEMEMLRRARFGVRKLLSNRKGEKPASVMEYNDALGLRLLLAHKQEVQDWRARHGDAEQQARPQLERLIDRLQGNTDQP